MEDTARAVMETRFFTVRPDLSIVEALRVFQEASAQLRRQVFGLVVLDYREQLVGMLSMYDILLLIRPKHIHIWGGMTDLDLTGILNHACRQASRLLVNDIMTTDLITVTPDTHLLYIIDIMIKKHVRRLPVLENGKVLGLVYLSRVFQHLLEKFGHLSQD